MLSGNDVLIICTKYYLDVVLKELDTRNGISPETYVSCSTHNEEIVSNKAYD